MTTETFWLLIFAAGVTMWLGARQTPGQRAVAGLGMCALAITAKALGWGIP